MNVSSFEQASTPGQPLLLAVSGGGDSLAMLHAVADWLAAAEGPKPDKVHVATVDHGLRPESATEADFVAEVSNRLGISHQILQWTDPRPQQGAARTARLSLLAKAAHQIGARDIWTGHTLEDVAETVVMRRQRDRPGHLLAGPSFLSVYPLWPDGRGLRLARPLITTRRQTLRDLLQTRNQAWIEDPSNQNPKYERVRVRDWLSKQAQVSDSPWIEVPHLLGLRAQADRNLAKYLQAPDTVSVAPSGLITLNISNVPAPRFLDVCAYLVRMAGGTDRLPDRAGLAKLTSLAGRMTLGGAWIEKRGDTLRFGRDPGEAHLRIENGLWDGRYCKDPHAPDLEDVPFILRQSAPSGPGWREIISERLAFETDILSRADVPAPLCAMQDTLTD